MAGVTSLSAFGFVADALLRNQQPGAAAQVLAALVAGWIGLGTCWRLYYCLMRKDLGFDHRRAWWGLACATLFAIGLIATAVGPLMSRIVYFGWPLLAVAFFSAVLWRLRENTHAV
ncbi:hypothetical protein D3C86_1895740 [compost metagenome]